jgi:gamma-butyrobetaine dioxygenase
MNLRPVWATHGRSCCQPLPHITTVEEVTMKVGGIMVGPDHLEFTSGALTRRLHHVWLRDNCGCDECRVAQSAERKLFTAEIPDAIAPAHASLADNGDLHLIWHDGHRSAFSAEWLRRFDYSNPIEPERDVVLWGSDLEVPTFDHDAMFSDPTVEVAYLEAVRRYGVAIVSAVPSEDHEVERFAERIGHVREVAFERVHNVFHDPNGYNVAHTPLELKPHTDMPSYHWPPSIQLLHFLANRAEGGESTVVDGWNALQRLRADDPTGFEVLTKVPVTYQLFSDTEDTWATAPMVQLDTAGNVALFRFSNQLALPVAADFDTMGEFYRAYRTLGRIIDSPESKVVFKSGDGDLLTVHGHRVLHGRLPFTPGTGERHLQDVYMEFDDFAARERVLRGVHIPMSPLPAATPADPDAMIPV